MQYLFQTVDGPRLSPRPPVIRYVHLTKTITFYPIGAIAKTKVTYLSVF